ncbi:MAG TPA: hypothetical protein VKC33_05380 [Burkholderiales bacterium]|nr:hypothetical protein [Burkholderiales bacterium]
MGQSIGRRELVCPEEGERASHGPRSETPRYAEYARIANVQLD